MAQIETEVYLSVQPLEKWQVIGFSGKREAPENRLGQTLIIEGLSTDVIAALAGKVNLGKLPAWYQGHLLKKGFVGISVPEMKKVLT